MLITIVVVLSVLSIGAKAQEPDPGYWRMDDIKAQFDTWETAYPNIFFQQTLGQTGLGESIPVACISHNAGVPEPEPSLFFHAAQHANECNGTNAIMAHMESLLTGYGIDPTITSRVEGLEIWFSPVVNVDGYRYVFSDQPNNLDWRKTLTDNNDNGQVDFPGDGVDLNRNWDWKWDQYNGDAQNEQYFKGPSPFSEPEVINLREFILDELPVLVVDYHSPVTISWHNTIFWPWSGGPDAGISRDLADDWARIH